MVLCKKTSGHDVFPQQFIIVFTSLVYKDGFVKLYILQKEKMQKGDHSLFICLYFINELFMSRLLIVVNNGP